MNKMIKGSVAGAAGIALLMGGFGTYALWSDSEQLDASQVQSGELTIDTSGGSYDDANTAADNDWTANDLMVPGDTVTYTQTFTVKGTGKNLRGTISLADLEGANNSEGITRSVAVTAAGGSAITQNTPTSFSFEDPFGTATLTAVVTYELPASTSGTTDQNKSVSTPAAQFTIQQTANN